MRWKFEIRFICEVLHNITTFLLSSCCEDMIKVVIEEILCGL